MKWLLQDSQLSFKFLQKIIPHLTFTQRRSYLCVSVSVCVCRASSCLSDPLISQWVSSSTLDHTSNASYVLQAPPSAMTSLRSLPLPPAVSSPSSSKQQYECAGGSSIDSLYYYYYYYCCHFYYYCLILFFICLLAQTFMQWAKKRNKHIFNIVDFFSGKKAI